MMAEVAIAALPGRRRLLSLLLAVGVATAASPARGGDIDLCGCAGSPASLGEFRSSIEATYPPGTTRSGQTITLALPEDGRLIFDSFTLDGIPGAPTTAADIRFTGNAANDPVRLLVAGDVTIPVSSSIDVNGFASAGTAVDPRGGLGGPGGFRGGDGAFEQTTLTRTGGHGLGPGGGAPGVANVSDPTRNGQDATSVGNNELIPLIGGSGGGGGSASAANCSGGGGGGGGGALLIAANGTLTLNGTLTSYGGGGSGPPLGGQCGSGGSGSAGAVRLVADTIAGNGRVYAHSPNNGIVRLEAFEISPNINTTPVATRSLGPAGEGLEVAQLAIATVNGETESRVNGALLAERPQGVFGGVDVIIAGGEPIIVGLKSTGLTGGTSVQVSLKGRTGGQRITKSVTLGGCSPQGACTATATFTDLAAGTYFVEAKATFQ